MTLNKQYCFPAVTLLITHYNRSNSLANLLRTFKEQNCVFGAIVVSDDGSMKEHLENIEELKKQFDFELITAHKNAGLGNNINKGQDAVRTPYTLYIQEDFEPNAKFAPALTNAIDFMEKRGDLDIVRFYSYLKYPYLRPYQKGFSEMYIPVLAFNYTKIYFYSDHPHLRRSNFFQRFGRYAEGIKGDKTEYKMCLSFIKNGGKGLFYNDYQGLFSQKNTESEPSTMTRGRLTQSNNLLIKIIRDFYRQVKYNYDLLSK